MEQNLNQEQKQSQENQERQERLVELNIYKDPDTIDAIINNKIRQFHVKGARSQKNDAWTEDLLELRDYVVFEYLRQGLSKERVAEELHARWDITLSTARKYVRQAIERFCENYPEENKEETRKIFMEKLSKILEMAIESQSKDAALRAMDIFAKTQGYYKENKDITLNGGDNPISFDFS